MHMKINRILVIVITVAVVVLVSVVIYKTVIEPTQLKKEYVSCVENAKAADYERWQEIEREIAEKDSLVKQLKIEADKRHDDFLDNHYVENKYSECMNIGCNQLCDNDLVGTSKYITLKRSACQKCLQEGSSESCVKQAREEIYRNVGQEENNLKGLYSKRNSNGEILEEELEECEKYFKMFSKSY
jgi:hypothetical protein